MTELEGLLQGKDDPNLLNDEDHESSYHEYLRGQEPFNEEDFEEH